MRIGSLCTGIAGLELGLQYAGIETKPVFVSDIDPGACAWLDQTMPHTPNLGDFTELDELPECDILTAGFPCQPVSTAGLRKGINDDRWLFDDICRLVSRMESRPVLFLENVPGILTANSGDAMARVVHGLADIGYYITWGTLPAAAIGAPHRRNRWWGLAQHPDSMVRPTPRQLGPDTNRLVQPWNGSRTVEGHSPAFADSERIRNRSGQGSLKEDGTSLRVVGRDTTAADTDGAAVRNEPDTDTRSSSAPVARHDSKTVADPNDPRRSQHWRSEPTQSELAAAEHRRDTATDTDSPSSQTRQHTRLGSERTRPQPVGHSPHNFGPYAEAVARWEHVLGRPAPAPHIEQRLNPAFVEHMMGYPEGWVTDVLTRRTQSLKALGNAVVPQCAAEAFLQLSTR